jgi:hypothetical protein
LSTNKAPLLSAISLSLFLSFSLKRKMADVAVIKLPASAALKERKRLAKTASEARAKDELQQVRGAELKLARTAQIQRDVALLADEVQRKLKQAATSAAKLKQLELDVAKMEAKSAEMQKIAQRARKQRDRRAAKPASSSSSAAAAAADNDSDTDDDDDAAAASAAVDNSDVAQFAQDVMAASPAPLRAPPTTPYAPDLTAASPGAAFRAAFGNQ